jgi:hypothetical protein
MLLVPSISLPFIYVSVTVNIYLLIDLLTMSRMLGGLIAGLDKAKHIVPTAASNRIPPTLQTITSYFIDRATLDRIHTKLLLLRLYSPLLGLGRFFSFLILYTVGKTPWTGNQPVARPLPIHRTNAHRHPCLQWDSNPRSLCSSERRQFML